MICDGSILRFVEKKGKKKHQRLKPLVLLCFGCKAQQMVQDMVLEELDEDLSPLRGDDPSVTLRAPPLPEGEAGGTEGVPAEQTVGQGVCVPCTHA